MSRYLTRERGKRCDLETILSAIVLQNRETGRKIHRGYDGERTQAPHTSGACGDGCDTHGITTEITSQPVNALPAPQPQSAPCRGTSQVLRYHAVQIQYDLPASSGGQRYRQPGPTPQDTPAWLRVPVPSLDATSLVNRVTGVPCHLLRLSEPRQELQFFGQTCTHVLRRHGFQRQRNPRRLCATNHVPRAHAACTAESRRSLKLRPYSRHQSSESCSLLPHFARTLSHLCFPC